MSKNTLCAKEIKEIRKKAGLTQTQFGEYLGIPMRTIQNWETGQRVCPEYLVDLIYFKMNFYEFEKAIFEAIDEVNKKE